MEFSNFYVKPKVSLNINEDSLTQIMVFLNFIANHIVIE